MFRNQTLDFPSLGFLERLTNCRLIIWPREHTKPNQTKSNLTKPNLKKLLKSQSLLQLRVKLYLCLFELAICTQWNIWAAVLSVRSAPSVGGRAAVYSTQWADAYSRDTPASGTSAYFLGSNTPSSKRKHRYSFNEGRDLSERKESCNIWTLECLWWACRSSVAWRAGWIDAWEGLLTSQPEVAAAPCGAGLVMCWTCTLDLLPARLGSKPGFGQEG